MSKRKTIRISEILGRINLHVWFCKVDGVIDYEKAERHMLDRGLEVIAKSDLEYFDDIRNLLFFCDILTENQSHALIDARYGVGRTDIQRYIDTLRLFNEYLGADA